MGNNKRNAASGKSKDAAKGGLTYRRFRTLRNGKVLDAHDYGYKAWPIGKKR